MKTMRLQRYLSLSGVSSRRAGEKLILAGRVSVNDCPVRELGAKIEPGKDRVTVDGRKISAREKIYVLLNKPAGDLCSLKDRFGRKLVTDLVGGIPERLYPVGRLDYDSEGLLILTNDGELCHRLTHPRHEIEKVYLVSLDSPLTIAQENELKRGVHLEGGEKARPAKVKIVSPDRLRAEVTIHEGKKRQVKRMLAAVGNRVLHLQRTALGPLKLGNLLLGNRRELSKREVFLLKRIGNPNRIE